MTQPLSLRSNLLLGILLPVLAFVALNTGSLAASAAIPQ